MPVTDLEKVNVHDRRIMGYVDFSTRLLDFLETSILRHTKARTTGPAPTDVPDPGGWFTSVGIVDGGGSNTLDFSGGDGGLYGTDGTGELISVDNGDDRLDEIPFEDAPATTYYVGVQTTKVPVEISTDTQTGTRYYDYTRREVGVLAEPSAAAVAGLGIQFTLANHQRDAGDDFTGRTAVCYLKDPVTGAAATAIETVTIVGITATTTGALGQSVVSTDPTDYEVVIVGPIITLDVMDATTTGVAFVGTVVGGGSPRAFDFSGQIELASLEDLSAYSNRLLKKGWLGTVPTVTNTATTISITTTGELVINGRLRTTAIAGPFGSLAATSDVWVSWDDDISDYVVTTTWDAAFSANRLPLVWAKTNGASNILNIVPIGRLVEEFPETLTITVATDPSVRAEFRSLRQAIAAVRSYQKGTTNVPRAAVIEIIGDATVTTSITETELFEAQNITFRGRGRRVGGGGSRIVWSFVNNGLFKLNDATINLNGWHFEDLTFRCAGVMTDVKAAIFSVRAAATMTDIQFRRCFVDGNTIPASIGGASGALPHFIYAEDGALSNIILDECSIFTTDTLILLTSGSDGLSDFTMRGGGWLNFGTPVGSVLGGILDASTGAARWKIEDTSLTALGGEMIKVDRLIGLRMSGNVLAVSATADIVAIQLGDTSYAGVRSVWIVDNEISSARSAGNGSKPVIRIRTADNGVGVGPGIFIHDNRISGDGVTTTQAGISVETNNTDVVGAIIHSNLIEDVSVGVQFISIGTGLTNGIVGLNYIEAGDVGVLFDKATKPIGVGNFITAPNASAIGFDVNVSALVLGNAIMGADVALDIDADDVVATGNLTEDRVSVTGNRILLTGNSMGENFEITGSSGKVILNGNLVVGLSDFSAGNGHILIGDYLTGQVTPPGSGQGDIIFCGVRIDDANNLDLLHDRGAIAGCIIDSADFTLNASSSEIGVAGNHFVDTTPTDSGTNNVLAGNS